MQNGTKKLINVSALSELIEHGINRVVLAIGVFDGVHRGHQKLLHELQNLAEAEKATPVALTFHPHPRAVIGNGIAPQLLISPAKKSFLLHHYGVEAVITIPFTNRFAQLSPADFIKDCLIAHNVTLAGICVGRKWRFGAGGLGSIADLKQFAGRGNFSLRAVDELILDNEAVSSTQIRRSIASGLLNKAADMLGRRYSLTGKVERGYNIASRELGHPTANLRLHYGIIPPDGVYAGRALWRQKSYPAAVNIGSSPTYSQLPKLKIPRVEVHLIDFSGDIYGEQLEVELLSYLREERSYPSSLELKEQIIADIERIKGLT